jgi:hypothetical protein
VLVDLLAAHPRIVLLSRDDAKYSSYWMAKARELADPASYLRWLHPERSSGSEPMSWWLTADTTRAGAPGEGTVPRATFDEDQRKNLYRMHAGNVGQIVAAGCRLLDAAYLAAARAAECENAAYCVEKAQVMSPVDLLLEVYPRGREVLLVRDFRDVVCSILAYKEKGAGWGLGSAQAAVDQIRSLSGPARRMARRRQEGAYVVRYEDLVTEPRQTLGRLLGHLDLEASDDALNAMQARLEQPAGQHGTAPSAPASIGRWRNDLSEELQALAEREFRRPLEVFGYG